MRRDITATYAPCMRRAPAKGHSYDVAFNVLTNARGPARSFIVFPQIAIPPYMGHPCPREHRHRTAKNFVLQIITILS